MKTEGFVHNVQQWQYSFGRHHLPWQGTADPYRVWLSEIMLQQTQVSTVIEYYQRFLARFPDVLSLANTAQEEVMPYWAGLGYYARARNLHRCAQIVVQDYAGQFPREAELLETLPGIGKSTANSIAAFCFNAITPIMDGNVKRVFTRFYGIKGYDSQTEKQLWAQAYANVEGENNIGQYNQGLMDLGSMVCTRTKPKCEICPLKSDCYAYAHQAQAEFPHKKPKKVIPQRETMMLIVRSGNQVLLHTRPQTGIWGGLLSLPEFSDETRLEQWLTDKPMLSTSRMASFEHVFSHYRLLIHPVLIELKPSKRAALSVQENHLFVDAADNYRWYALSDYERLALPSPVQKILSGLI